MTTPTRDGAWEIDGTLNIGNGTVYPIASVEGLGVPDTKTSDADTTSGHGRFYGDDWLDERIVVVRVGIAGVPDSAAYDAALAALAAVMAPRAADMPVVYRRFGRNRLLNARPRGLVLPWDQSFGLGAAIASLRLDCADPRVYAAAATSVAGHTSGTITNGGNVGTWPTVATNGAGSAVSIANSTAGRTVTLAGLTGDVTVDFKNRTVVYTSGGASAIDALTSDPDEWWALAPGANTVSVTGATSIDVDYSDAYLTG